MTQRGWAGIWVLGLAVVLTFRGIIATAAAPAGQVSILDGTISAVRGNGVTIASPGAGDKVVQVDGDTLILNRQPAVRGEIKPGDALGVAAKRGTDGSLTAISINIFSPELWSRATKGQFPMASGDVMTNAVVAQYVERVEGHTLYMKLDQGNAPISVPAATEIHRLVTAHLGDLKPGMRATVRGNGNPDGTIKASSITFEGHN